MPATHHTSAPPTTGPAGAASAGPPGRDARPPAAGPGADPHAPNRLRRRGPPGPPPRRPLRTRFRHRFRLRPAPRPWGVYPCWTCAPVVLRGRRPAKAVVGETFEVSATVFREGHDAVGRQRGADGPGGPARALDADAGAGPRHRPLGRRGHPDAEGRWTYRVEAWGDPGHHLAAPRAGSRFPAGHGHRAGAGGGRAAVRAGRRPGVPEEDGRARAVLRAAVDALRDDRPPGRLPARGGADARGGPRCWPAVRCGSWSAPRRPLPLLVERERALFGSWYEFFPRSEAGDWTRAAARHLPHRRASGCRPSRRWASTSSTCRPIHPIGTTFRKGPNNTLSAGPDDVGVPWAIGSPEGGHDAIHPDLGTLEDFDAFVARARELRPGDRAGLRPAVLPGPSLGGRSTRSGSTTAATARSRTRRTRRRSTRTSTRSPSTRTWTASSPRPCGCCGTGWPTGCGSSGWTTRTPSRWCSGSG